MTRKRESRARDVSLCTSRATDWWASWAERVCYYRLTSFILQLMPLPPTSALLLCVRVRPCVLMLISHVWLLSCRNRTSEHRHLVDSMVHLQVHNSPDLGPRNNNLHVTDISRVKCKWLDETEIGVILWNVRMSASNGFNLRIASVPFLPPLVLQRTETPLWWSSDTGATASCSTWAALHSLLDMAMWRVEPVYSSITGEGTELATRLFHSCCKISYKDTRMHVHTLTCSVKLVLSHKKWRGWERGQAGSISVSIQTLHNIVSD